MNAYNLQLQALYVALQINQPILLWGSPGIGKTASVNALASSLEWHLETVIASIRDPTDFGGIPFPQDGYTAFLAPSWAKRLNEKAEEINDKISDLSSSNKNGGILFLDEISTAPPAVQAALLRVIWERVIGDLQLNPKIRIVAAANPADQAASGWDLSPPMANRFCHLDWQIDQESWCLGIINGFQIPNLSSLKIPMKDFNSVLPNVTSLISSFINKHKALLLNIPKEENQLGRAWPSPRSWDSGIKFLTACRTLGKKGSELESTLLSGSIGSAATLEFYSWEKNIDLPDPEKIIKKPSLIKEYLSKRNDINYAILSSVYASIQNNFSDVRWYAGLEIFSLAAGEGYIDTAALFGKYLFQNGKKPENEDLVKIGQFLEAFKAILSFRD